MYTYMYIYTYIYIGSYLKPVMGLRALILEKGRFRQIQLNLRQNQQRGKISNINSSIL